MRPLEYDWGILIEYVFLALLILVCFCILGMLAEDFFEDETENENGKKKESDLQR